MTVGAVRPTGPISAPP